MQHLYTCRNIENFNNRFIMKKIYLKPNIAVMKFQLEQVIASSTLSITEEGEPATPGEGMDAKEDWFYNNDLW